MSAMSAPGREPANPFSTRFIRPGAIPYRFAAGHGAAALVARLRDNGWRGQIVGPHGSGKSTLLAALAPALAQAGRRPVLVPLAANERRMPRGWTAALRDAPAGIVVVDGFEQLNAARRALVRARCRLGGWGLLVTAHRDLGLPTLFATEPTLETAQWLAEHLVAERSRRLPRDVVAECFAASGANLRETLFLLYDRWRQARP